MKRSGPRLVLLAALAGAPACTDDSSSAESSSGGDSETDTSATSESESDESDESGDDTGDDEVELYLMIGVREPSPGTGSIEISYRDLSDPATPGDEVVVHDQPCRLRSASPGASWLGYELGDNEVVFALQSIAEGPPGPIEAVPGLPPADHWSADWAGDESTLAAIGFNDAGNQLYLMAMGPGGAETPSQVEGPAEPVFGALDSAGSAYVYAGRSMELDTLLGVAIDAGQPGEPLTLIEPGTYASIWSLSDFADQRLFVQVSGDPMDFYNALVVVDASAAPAFQVEELHPPAPGVGHDYRYGPNNQFVVHRAGAAVELYDFEGGVAGPALDLGVDNATQIWLSANGRFLFIVVDANNNGDLQSDLLWVVDLDGGPDTPTAYATINSGGPMRARGEWLMWVNGNNQFVVARAGDTLEAPVGLGQAYDLPKFALDRDGQRAYWTGLDQPWTVDLSGGVVGTPEPLAQAFEVEGQVHRSAVPARVDARVLYGFGADVGVSFSSSVWARDFATNEHTLVHTEGVGVSYSWWLVAPGRYVETDLLNSSS